MNRSSFPSDAVVLVAKCEDFQSELRIGDMAQLNSGGPPALVLDIGEEVTIAWRDISGAVHEVPRACVHRIHPR